jgi:hypothetical protein
MESELSLIKFAFMNFWAVLIQTRPFNPISTLLVKLVEALISSELEPDIKVKNRLKWISEHTHERVNEPLSIIELAVFKNLDKGLNREIDIGNKTFSLIVLYKYLNEISDELAKMTVEIGKKYSLDIPQMQFNKSQMMSIE